jgi:hypothetical protein
VATRRVLPAAALALAALAGAAPLHAVDLAGSTVAAADAEPAPVSLTISDARVTALRMRFVGACGDGSSFSGQVALQGPAVRIAPDGRVRVPVGGRHERGLPIAGVVLLAGASDRAEVVRGEVQATLDSGRGPCAMRRPLLAVPVVPDRPGPRPGFATAAGAQPAVSFDVLGRALRAVHAAGPSGCAGSGPFAWSGAARGVQQVPLAGDGAFRQEGWALTDAGDVARLTLSGRLAGGAAAGRLTVEVPARPGCVGVTTAWSATARGPAGAGRPEVSLSIGPYKRTAASGARPDFGLAVTRVSCVAATHFDVAVAGRTRRVSCAASRRPYTVVARGLRGDRIYGVRVTALRLAAGRVRARGVTFTDVVRIPPAGDPAWTPIT